MPDAPVRASDEIWFDGTDLRTLPPEARARLGIGYVPQGREIFPQLSVEENLRVGLGIRRGDRERFHRECTICFPF
jgi:urea transport system ATP-binding protein